MDSILEKTATFKNIDDEELEQLIERFSNYTSNDTLTTQQPLSQKNIEGLYSMAYHFYEKGQYQKAVDFFRFLTLLDSVSKKNWIGLGASFFLLKKYEKAIEAYGFAALLDAEDPCIHLYAADCFFALGRVTEGLRAVDSVESLVNENEKYRDLTPAIRLRRETYKNTKII